jgi:16S rRNA (cytosine1402-N4)-methyltransferase
MAAADGKLPWYLDGTIGGAGHALAIAQAFKGNVNVIGLDRDQQAIERAKQSFTKLEARSRELEGIAGKAIFECESFRNLDKILDKHAVQSVDMILFDLGISSDELENSGRGFSFMKDEPLLMTMGDPASYPFTAKDIVNGWKEEDIANVIFAYGEERFARRIARAIVAYREKKLIETTTELAEIVKMAIPGFARRMTSSPRLRSPSKIHPATKTFQALRIAVNDELAALKEGLTKGFERLSPGGRMAVISFHSLEDRIVKEFSKEKAAEGVATMLTKRPITASPQELAENPRSRSAKLRILQKNQ